MKINPRRPLEMLFASWLALAPLLFSATIKVDHHLPSTPETVNGYWWGGAKPVLRIKSGEVVEIDTDGEVLARPITWTSEEPPPKIFMQPERRGHPALLPGDRVLAQLQRQNDRTYSGRTIRKLEKTGLARVLGIYEMTPDGARLREAPAGWPVACHRRRG